MSAEQLALVGSRLVKRCGTRDPFEIAADIGVEVMFCDNFGPLKGMYRVIKRNRFIFINTGAGQSKGNPQLAGGSPRAENAACRNKGYFQRQGAERAGSKNPADGGKNLRHAGSTARNLKKGRLSRCAGVHGNLPQGGGRSRELQP